MPAGPRELDNNQIRITETLDEKALRRPPLPSHLKVGSAIRHIPGNPDTPKGFRKNGAPIYFEGLSGGPPLMK